MGQTLTNGTYLPAEGERNCYEGLAANWTALDGLIGGYNVHISNTTIHVTAADKEAWNGKADASALTAHTGDTTIHVTAEDKQAWNGKADASALTAHTGDTTIHVTSADKQAWNGHVADSVKHVTAEDKAAWNGKADASALTAHTGDTTIHVTAEDKQAWDGHVADSVKHVTAEDKNKWDAVTSKANDSDVVHKSGNETVSGIKTFSDEIIRGTTNTNSTIQSRSLIGKTTASTTGSDSYSYQAITVTLNYSDSTPSKSVSVSLYVVENAYSTGKFSAFRPNSNNLVDLGTNSKRWANVFATKYYYGSNGVEFSTKFVTTDTAQTISGNKTFSSINGVEPSSLSLPNLSAGVDISGYITNLNKGVNTYTPPANGWLSIRVKKTSLSHASLMLYQTDGLLSSCETDEFNTSGTNLPVIANQNVEIYVYADVLVEAKFYPCQGNV